MVASGAVPWYNVPARPFPAMVWLEGYYPFTISPTVFARRVAQPGQGDMPGRRVFPAKRWLEQQRCMG